MTLPKISILGEVLFDCFAEGVQVLGGAPFNVAWHLQALKQPSLFISCVGQDKAGDEVLSAMRGWGMHTEGLQQDPIHPTGRVEISLTDGEPHYSILDHQAYDHINFTALPQPKTCWLYHGSLALRHESAIEDFLQWRQIYNGKVFIDINLRAPWWSHQQLEKLIKGADWLKLNQEELRLLNPVGANTLDQLKRLMASYDLSAILLTQGAEGAQLCTADGEIYKIKPQQQSEIIDSVGAGDAFAAICLLGLIAHWPYQLMLERAQVFASALLSQRGAIVRQPEFYRSFIRQWQI